MANSAKARPRRDDRAGVLIERYRETKDAAVLEQLTEELMPWLQRLARRFAGRGLEFDDLLQVASVGLVMAVERFDPARGYKFSSFAEPTITGEIKRHFRDHGWSVRPPRDLQERAAEINQVSVRLTGELGRSPTLQDIAEETGASVEDVLSALHASSAWTADSLDQPVSDELPLTPALVDDEPVYKVADDRIELAEAMSVLPERDRLVIHLSFFEDLTQSQIAERVGVSQMQVSRIIRNSLQRMRESIDEPAGEVAKDAAQLGTRKSRASTGREGDGERP